MFTEILHCGIIIRIQIINFNASYVEGMAISVSDACPLVVAFMQIYKTRQKAIILFNINMFGIIFFIYCRI